MTWLAMAMMWFGGFLGGAWVALIFLSDPRGEATKRFWQGYARGIEDEQQRMAENARPIASRLSEGPLLFGVSLDELTKGKPTQ